MAIDIICYTKLDVNSLQSKLENIRSHYKNLFEHSYVMYDAHKIFTYQEIELINDRVEKYNKETKLLIAKEFGLDNAKSYFMLSVNDKFFPEMNTSEMAELLRKELGEEHIIVLLDGETLI